MYLNRKVYRVWSYQVFDSVRPVIPLWGAELIATLHDHPKHQHLFAMPEWR